METTLHRQLKTHYAGTQAQIEVPLGRYRIDIVDGERLIEVQHSGLSSIRDKVRFLLKKHEVEVIKPLVARKRLISLTAKDGDELKRRWSPKRCTRLDVFHELIYFTRVFPHRRLTLRIPLIEIEEARYPHQRRNKRRGQFKVQDQSPSCRWSAKTSIARGEIYGSCCQRTCRKPLAPWSCRSP